MMSHLATWRGQPRLGLDHALAAQGWASQVKEPRLTAYSATVAAKAYAAMNQTRSCLHALGMAEQALTANIENMSETARMYFYTPGLFLSTQSECLLKLNGRLSQVIDTAQESLVTMDSSFVRNRAFTKLNIADAYIGSGDIGMSTTTINEAIPLVTQNRSSRLIAQLRTTSSHLRPWNQDAGVRTIHEHLEAVGLAV